MYVQLNKVLLEVKQADDQGELADGQPMVLWVWQNMRKIGCNVMFGVGGCMVMNNKRITVCYWNVNLYVGMSVTAAM